MFLIRLSPAKFFLARSALKNRFANLINKIMKKLLLLASAIAVGVSVQAQKFSGAVDLQKTTANTELTSVPVAGHGEKTAKNGDTISRSHIPAGGPFVYYFVGTTPYDSGNRSGFNAYGDKGWAERFDVKGTDSSVLPIGVFGYVFGRSAAGSTKTLRAAVWAQGARVGVTGRPKLFYSGLPTGTPLNSTTITFPNLRESTTTGVIDTVIYMRFPTVGSYVADSFFAGFDIPGGYNWTALGGDTLTVVQDTNGVRYGDRLAMSPSYIVVAGDTIINTQNATLSPATGGGDRWDENFIGGGNSLYNNFFIGVVFRVRTLSVEGITRNGLTIFGTVPNPATNSTKLKMSLKAGTSVTVQIMDMSGRIVHTAPVQQLSAGTHELPISTENLASGIYNCLIRTANGDAMGIEMSVVR